MVTIKEWVDALRSGKYEQGQNRLRTNDCFCCLGVYCDLIDPHRWKHLPSLSTSEYDYYDWKGEDGYYKEWMPAYLSEKLGLIGGSGALPIDVILDKIGGIVKLADLNDQKFTFIQIADLLEYVFYEQINKPQTVS